MKFLFSLVLLGLSFNGFSAACPRLEGTYVNCKASVSGGKIPHNIVISKITSSRYDLTVSLSDEVGDYQDSYSLFVDGVAREYDEIPFLIEEKSSCRQLEKNVYEVLTSFRLLDPYDRKLISSYYQGVARKDKTIVFTDYTDVMARTGSITCYKK